MPFIGQEPITGAYHVLDAITASATATYNLQLNSGAFSPATANQLLVSLNGVIQKPGSSFTISGSQITFSSALTSSDSIDFIIALGDVLNVGTPTDGSVSTAKLATDAVTTAKIANSAITDAKIGGMAASKLTGAMPALDGSALTGTGKMEVVSYSHTGGSAVSTIEIDLPTDTKYRYFKLLFSDWYGSTGADIRARFRRLGQSSVDTASNYHWMLTGAHHSQTAPERRSSNGDSSARLNWYGHGNSNLEHSTIEIDIFESNSSSETLCMHRRWGKDSNANVTMDTGGFVYYYNIVTDRIQLYPSSGTITYSAYTLYGILRE